MNTSLSNRRLWALMMAPLFVFTLARLLFVVGIPFHCSSANPWPQTPKFKAPISHAIIHRQVVVTPQPVQAKVVVQSNSLSLKSSLHDFNYVFSGQVTCGGRPCMADLHVTLSSDHNDELKQIFSTDKSGHFETRMAFKENLQQLLDWHVMVYTPHTYPAELRGRQILTDDGNLKVEKIIQLP